MINLPAVLTAGPVRRNARNSALGAGLLVASFGASQMFVRATIALLSFALVSSGPLAAKTARSHPRQTTVLTAEAINDAGLVEKGKPSRAGLVRLAVLLERAHFSPGVIDGLGGDNLTKALQAYKRSQGLRETAGADPATLLRLTESDSSPVIAPYVITNEDVKGPFTPHIPAKLEDQAALDRLGYRDIVELLSERFHMDEKLLRDLNKAASFDRPGTTIQVANVDRSDDPTTVGKPRPRRSGARDQASVEGQVAKITVDKVNRSLTAFDRDGHVVAFYPASIGSTVKPAPTGTLEVVRVAPNPSYTYNPKYEFKGVEATEKFSIKPGPNNPVGAVWIALNGEGYGIHGTPEPSKVGKTSSHGCVRLTNWDALELARLVRKGVPVEFGD